MYTSIRRKVVGRGTKSIEIPAESGIECLFVNLVTTRSPSVRDVDRSEGSEGAFSTCLDFLGW